MAACQEVSLFGTAKGGHYFLMLNSLIPSQSSSQGRFPSAKALGKRPAYFFIDEDQIQKYNASTLNQQLQLRSIHFP
jgi:hypothetical protein